MQGSVEVDLANGSTGAYISCESCTLVCQSRPVIQRQKTTWHFSPPTPTDGLEDDTMELEFYVERVVFLSILYLFSQIWNRVRDYFLAFTS